MTVEELVRALQKLPGNMPVKTGNGRDGTIEDVQLSYFTIAEIFNYPLWDEEALVIAPIGDHAYSRMRNLRKLGDK